MDTNHPTPETMLKNWNMEQARTEEILTGHINRTWRVTHEGKAFALQWLNPIFAPEVHLDMEAITSRLQGMGLVTPRLVRTSSGKLWAEDHEAGVWRLFTWIEGKNHLSADSPEMCHEAGRLLGKFHSALWDFRHEFAFTRLGVHDTQKHISNLSMSLKKHAEHSEFDSIAPVAHDILDEFSTLDLDISSPERIVHGDPKLSNIVFDQQGKAICMLDLDTLARMPIALELGDALRSWCNPAGEEMEPDFRLDFFSSALEGYARAMVGKATREDWGPIPRWTRIISLELAARFCTDALEESYFRWDAQKFASASEHNLLRAKVQLSLAKSMAEHEDAMEKANHDIWPTRT